MMPTNLFSIHSVGPKSDQVHLVTASATGKLYGKFHNKEDASLFWRALSHNPREILNDLFLLTALERHLTQEEIDILMGEK
jgi:hypothetical protein